MLIKYKNYTIEDDRNGYILNIFGTVKDEKSKNFGKEAILETFYPSTIESAVKRIARLETSKKDASTLEWFIESFKEVNRELETLISKI